MDRIEISGVSLSDADEILEYTWLKSMDVMVQNGEHAPIFFVFMQSTIIIYDCREEFATQDGKHKMTMLMHEYANREQVNAIAYVGEAWAVEGDDLDQRFCEKFGVAMHPAKVEVLYVTVENRTTMIMRQAKILRDEAGELKEVAKPETVHGAHNIGTLAGFFAQGQA